MRTIETESYDFDLELYVTKKGRVSDAEAYRIYEEQFENPTWGQIEGCCGVTEIHGFLDSSEADLDTIDDEIWFTNQWIQKDHSFRNMYGEAGIRLITLNQWQENHFGKAVRAAGYKKKASAVNPKTRNNIYVYLLEVHPIKPKKGKKFVSRRFK